MEDAYFNFFMAQFEKAIGSKKVKDILKHLYQSLVNGLNQWSLLKSTTYKC